jgi:hypothetical protein
MARVARAATALGLAAASACSASDPEPAARPPVTDAPATSAAASASAPGASASAAQPTAPDPIPRLAKALFPGRLDPDEARTGWVASKKAFLLADGVFEDGAGSSLVLVLEAESPEARVTVPVCAAGECDAPGARTKLEDALRGADLGGTVVLDPIEFPFGPQAKPEVDVGALAAKVTFKVDHLEILRKDKPPVKLPPVKATPPHKPKPLDVTASPDGTHLAFTFLVDPATQQTNVYKLPAP